MVFELHIEYLGRMRRSLLDTNRLLSHDENFRRKAKKVADGHTTETPAVMTYASVVSKETVCIALTIASLNDLYVKGADIERTLLGPEWGPDAGKKAIMVRAQYGLKSAGTSFRNHLAECILFI